MDRKPILHLRIRYLNHQIRNVGRCEKHTSVIVSVFPQHRVQQFANSKVVSWRFKC